MEFKIDELLVQKYPLNILLAEDDTTNQILTECIFKKMGYDIDIVDNGIKVIEALKSKNYDLIFMDIMMPMMNGIDATKKILSSPNEKSNPKIIALTAMARQEDKESCLEAGMNDYISKPFTLEIIQNTLIKWGTIISSN